MINNLYLARKFYALMCILLMTLTFFVVHLGFVIDIPYVPTMLVFKLPAFLLFTLFYIELIVTLWNIQLTMKIVEFHKSTNTKPSQE